MDADYDPTKALQNELIDSGKKKKRRRKSKFAEVIAKEKPKFDPKLHASYRDYIEQYYALDYEDMIDDLPCRFKYRKVVPNDYGLSVEEVSLPLHFFVAREHFPHRIPPVNIETLGEKIDECKKKNLTNFYRPFFSIQILAADDRELNKWCSLKKALEHKPENVELKEVQIYKQKAKNEEYKKKVLKSLYT